MKITPIFLNFIWLLGVEGREFALSPIRHRLCYPLPFTNNATLSIDKIIIKDEVWWWPDWLWPWGRHPQGDRPNTSSSILISTIQIASIATSTMVITSDISDLSTTLFTEEIKSTTASLEEEMSVITEPIIDQTNTHSIEFPTTSVMTTIASTFMSTSLEEALPSSRPTKTSTDYTTREEYDSKSSISSNSLVFELSLTTFVMDTTRAPSFDYSTIQNSITTIRDTETDMFDMSPTLQSSSFYEELDSDITITSFPLVTTTIIVVNGHTKIPILTTTFAYAQSTDVTLITNIPKKSPRLPLSDPTPSIPSCLLLEPTISAVITSIKARLGAAKEEDECWAGLYYHLKQLVYDFPGPSGKLVVVPVMIPRQNSNDQSWTIHLTSLERKGMNADGVELLVGRVAILLNQTKCLPWHMVVVENRGIIITTNSQIQ